MDNGVYMSWDDKMKFDQFTKKYLEADEKAKVKVAYQILSDILNTSPRPPILTSALWGSGSVFVGNKMVFQSKDISSVIKRADPNTALSGKSKQTITVGFNIAYAARMHKKEWNWGKVSRAAGGVGSKFITRHLQGQAANYTKIYTIFVKKEMGM